jgi:UDP-N-acetylmuramate--alanine ligase
VDDPYVREILPFVSKPAVTYGTGAEAMVRAEGIEHAAGMMRFRVLRAKSKPMEVTLNLPGHHNVLNSLAAIAVGIEVGIPERSIVKALAEFRGVGRRFQRCGEIALDAAKPGAGHFTLVDDYGHHPAEMAATIAAARGAFPGRRLVLAFQPHRYSRTRDLFEEFVKVLSTADALVLADVYAAGEPAITGANGNSLARAVRAAGKIDPLFVEDIGRMAEGIRRVARDGDVVLTMGAGSIGNVAGQFS